MTRAKDLVATFARKKHSLSANASYSTNLTQAIAHSPRSGTAAWRASKYCAENSPLPCAKQSSPCSIDSVVDRAETACMQRQIGCHRIPAGSAAKLSNIARDADVPDPRYWCM